MVIGADIMSEAELIIKECQNLQKTLLAKNKDYGNAFGKTFQDLGPITGLTRFLDKVNRIKNLTKQQSNGLVKDENILDTWEDAAGYAILNLIELKKLQEKDKNK